MICPKCSGELVSRDLPIYDNDVITQKYFCYSCNHKWKKVFISLEHLNNKLKEIKK